MQEQLDRLDKELKETDNAVRDLHANLDAYAKIAAYDWYKPHQDILGDTGRAAAREITPRKSCIELIEELGRDETSSCNYRQDCARKSIFSPGISMRTILSSLLPNSTMTGSICALLKS